MYRSLRWVWRMPVALGLVVLGLWPMMAVGSAGGPAEASGANLVPIVRHLVIQKITFRPGYHSVVDGCVSPGYHRIMRFEFLIHNIGDEDAVIGDPLKYPHLFAFARGHDHYHVKDFNEFKLLDRYGYAVMPGAKQGFCLVDTEKMDPRAGRKHFGDCSYQGISAGWADLYKHDLSCQFIVIGNIPDGEYTLRSTTNAQRVIEENNFQDNTTYTDLRIYRGKARIMRVHDLASWIAGNGRRPPRR